MIWPLIIAGGAVALAFFLLMDLATLPARERSGSIRRAAGYGRNRAVSSTSVLDDGTFRDRALIPMKTGLARAVLRITPRASVETVTNKLLRAGLNRKVSPTSYLASKAILGFLGFVGGQVFASLAGVLPKEDVHRRGASHVEITVCCPKRTTGLTRRGIVKPHDHHALGSQAGFRRF